ncbi:MAG: 23S rRNA (pseudouridine(1915)-N(3))-methyltransferase RlmH [Gammaproteobacteria bacterium]
MRVHLIAVGTRMPAWVGEAYTEYAGRLAAGWRMELHEVPMEKRVRNADIARLRDREGERLLAAVPTGARIVTLDEHGRSLSTRQLADRLNDWSVDGRELALLVGGPDGLSPACRDAADFVWSLSPLTFPHPLVRVILAEQMYRAWSVLQGHPYHRD